MARDAIGIANETAQHRVEDNAPVVTGLAGHAAVNHATSHGMTNGTTNGTTNGMTNGMTNGAKGGSSKSAYKPDSWMPLEEHVLLHPTRKTKVISIGCGFSGMVMQHPDYRQPKAQANVCQA